MRSFPPKNKRLLYRYEVMSARLNIRDFFQKVVVQEVYENIGQVLSVVRLQLGSVNTYKSEDLGVIQSAGNLIEQSIKDLRKMCRSFFPDTDILQEDGFVYALALIIKTIYPDTGSSIHVKGRGRETEPGLRLIVFGLIHELLLLIREAGGKYKSIVVSYAKQKVTYVVTYSGDEVDLMRTETGMATTTGLTLVQKAELIEGKLEQKRTRVKTQIKLITPLSVFLK